MEISDARLVAFGLCVPSFLAPAPSTARSITSLAFSSASYRIDHVADQSTDTVNTTPSKGRFDFGGVPRLFVLNEDCDRDLLQRSGLES